MEFLGPYALPILQIIWIDLILSGDNAVVIALACRSLPPKQRRMGILLGAGTAVGLRIVFAVIVSYILAVPFLKVIGALLLLWIALKLVRGEDEAGHEVEAGDNLWRAVRTIAIADAVMSFDNVIAIVGASHGNNWLFVFGLLLSIPLIIFGAGVFMVLLQRYPFLIWLGAALLGWISGEMLVSDPAVIGWLGADAAARLHYPAAIVGALLVLGAGRLLRRRRVGEAQA